MSELPVLMTLECKGPAVKWSSLTDLQRFQWMFLKDSAETTCGESTVIIDTSTPDDFWPEYCPKCGTDVNWDISVVEKMQMLELKLNGHMI
jgi:hypothetical protein